MCYLISTEGTFCTSSASNILKGSSFVFMLSACEDDPHAAERSLNT